VKHVCLFVPLVFRVDVRYVAHNPRLDFLEDTKVSATLQEDAAWRERIASSAGASSSNGVCVCVCVCVCYARDL
jgi:hypothetical protein